MTEEQLDETMKLIFELQSLIGTAVTWRERRIIDETVCDVCEKWILDKLGNGFSEWSESPGPLRKALEA